MKNWLSKTNFVVISIAVIGVILSLFQKFPVKKAFIYLFCYLLYVLGSGFLTRKYVIPYILPIILKLIPSRGEGESPALKILRGLLLGFILFVIFILPLLIFMKLMFSE
jgi:hypothetical protein